MSLSFGIAIYFVIWWVLLFAILPFGVRTSEEAGESSNPGFAESKKNREANGCRSFSYQRIRAGRKNCRSRCFERP
jgi:predicted secreted protein